MDTDIIAWLVISAICLAFIFFLIVEIFLACRDRDNNVVALGIVAIICLSILTAEISAEGFHSYNDGKYKAAYNINKIDCVYPDNGNSADAEVQYYTNGGIRKFSARELGYCKVVVNNDIKKPEEKLTPSGKILFIPESYLRYKS